MYVRGDYLHMYQYTNVLEYKNVCKDIYNSMYVRIQDLRMYMYVGLCSHPRIYLLTYLRVM
jgi:hypothetical protein